MSRHPVIVRITHWLNAVAMICLIMSGWLIYDASPLFGFSFPRWATLGGWLGGAIAWHFAAMWLVVVNGGIYLLWGAVTGHFARRLFPIRAGDVWRDFRDALHLRLVHGDGYNSVQRLFYVGTIGLGVLAVASGLSLWKPVQLHALTSAFGGYETARRVHFAAMSGIVLFLLVHLALVSIVPQTLRAITYGRAAAKR